MNIKFAQPDDLCEIDDLYRGYLSPVPFDHDRVAETLADMIRKNCVIVAEEEGKLVGVLAGYLFPSLFDTNVYFVTMFSYFKESHRHLTGPFFDMIDRVLETTPATMFFVGVPHYQDEEKMGRFYKMKGFARYETHYAKKIGAGSGKD